MLHPLSHNCPTEMSELCTSPGRMCAYHACGGKSVNNRLHVCDNWIVAPLGMLTLSGTCAACLSLHGAAADKKLLVHPESRIAVSFVVTSVKNGVQSKDSVKRFNLSSITLAAPPHHSLPHWTLPIVLLLFAES
jgi:hypothetical protein